MIGEIIKFARPGEPSNKIITAHIFPEEKMFTIELRAYNGDEPKMAGDVTPRSDYEKYVPILAFEFYQKASVVALRDTCNWLIDALAKTEENKPDTK